MTGIIQEIVSWITYLFTYYITKVHNEFKTQIMSMWKFLLFTHISIHAFV